MSEHPPLIFEDNFAQRRNMAFRVERGRIDPNNPLLVGEYPWDAATPFYNGTVLIDPIDGKWKLWGINLSAFENHAWGEWDLRMGYAESDDGVNWTRPMLDGFPCMGRDKSNVLFDFSTGGNCFQMSTLIDIDAEPDSRYELFILRQPGFKNPAGLAGVTGRQLRLFRYLSGDGIHWRLHQGPLDIESADSLFVYRDIGAPYVAYHKMGPPAPPGSAMPPHECGCGTIRIVCRRESQDGFHWSEPPLQVVVPDWRDAHDDQCMDLGPIKWGRGYLATVAIFHGINQSMDLQFAASLDGKQWYRPVPRVPCVPHGSLGDAEGWHLFQSHSLVEDGDQVHVYYFAAQGVHSDLFTPVDLQRTGHGQEAAYPTGGLSRATWDAGRFWSIVPGAAGPSQAIATTFPIDEAGKTLHINALTIDDGEIAAELCPGDGWTVEDPLPGYSRDDCIGFRGDSKCTKLVWKEHETCPRDDLLLRLYVRRARLYGFDWR